MLEDLRSSLQSATENALEDILEDCIRITKESIQECVYDAYTPLSYERTNKLKDSIVGEIKNGTVYIYHDSSVFEYESVYRSEFDINEVLPYIIDYSGHKARVYEGDINMFNYYPSITANRGRMYLDLAKREIENKYGVNVEIIGR